MSGPQRRALGSNKRQSATAPALVCNPIGVIRTPMQVKFDAPHQPDHRTEQESTIVLHPGKNFEMALRDLGGFEWIWLIWWFHRNSTWRPMVLPPRGGSKRRGVFATRSPHRPNPIGITAVRLLGISGRTLTVGSNDLVDGTPLLDIKPYLRSVDSFPEAVEGWIGEVERELTQTAPYQVIIAPVAEQQIRWLKDSFGVDFASRALELLRQDPRPHRTRRITQAKTGLSRMGCGAWRIFFRVEGVIVTVEYLAPGYPARLLNDQAQESVPDREAQLAFLRAWPL